MSSIRGPVAQPDGFVSPPSEPVSSTCPNCGFDAMHNGVCDRCNYSLDQQCEAGSAWEVLRVESVYGEDSDESDYGSGRGDH